MLISDLDYELPPRLIAVSPAEPRDQSRLMVVHRSTGAVEHRRFFELPDFFRGAAPHTPEDLLVVNDTRVIPAKLELKRKTGAVVPGLFLAEKEVGLWQVMLRTRGRVKVGDQLVAGKYQFLLEERVEGEKGIWIARLTPAEPAAVVLAVIGGTPLPPYIEKQRRLSPQTKMENAQVDRTRYQTVYARAGHSIAAPTAGLHFTPELLARIDHLGVRRATVNLQVGMGTFLPVETETLEAHHMHTEEYSIPAQTLAAIRDQRRRGGRIVVVGTTAVRTLESAAARIMAPSSTPADIHDTTDLKIAPGYTFQLTDVLLTNFHLPRSTLMALVGALVGIPRLKQLYALAVRENYRFYSYGDAMLILP